MKKTLVALAFTLVASQASATIASSSHDFTGAFGGTLSTCTYCHAPHWSNSAVTAAPLWNRDLGTTSDYTLYTGSLIVAQRPTAVNANSLTCLSCHDGRTAIGNLYGTNQDAGLTSRFVTAGTNVGTNLADDHPVSIQYTTTTGKQPIATVRTALKLYGTGEDMVECASCHDPHLTTNTRFLRAPIASFCAECHIK